MLFSCFYSCSRRKFSGTNSPRLMACSEVPDSELTECSGSISDVRSNLSSVEAALIQLSISSNYAAEGGDGNPPNYRNDLVEPAHILDHEEDLLNLDWSVVKPDRVAPVPQQPLGDMNVIHSISKSSSQDTVGNSIDISESGFASLKPSTFLDGLTAEKAEKTTNVTISSHGTDLNRSGDGKFRENPSQGPPGVSQDRLLSAPFKSPEAREKPPAGCKRKYDPRKSSPALIRAVYRGDIEEVKSLLAAGNDIEACHPVNKRTAVIIAAFLGDSDILEILLDSGASLKAIDRTNRTALHYAASEGMIECVNLLLSRKAPLYDRDILGDLPLHSALQGSSEEAVKAMLGSYPSPLEHLDAHERNILHLAAATQPASIINLILDHIRRVKHKQDCSNPTNRTSGLCVKYDCLVIYPGIEMEDEVGETALQIAITRWNMPVVSLLLRCCPSHVDSPRKKYKFVSKRYLLPERIPWERALHTAIRHSHLELLTLLLDAQASIELHNSNGKPPLALAIHEENRDATTALIAHGADYTSICTKHNDRSLLEEAVQAFSPTILDDLVSSRPNLDLSTSEAAVFVLRQAQIFGRWEAIQKLVQQSTKKELIGRILDEEETLYHALISSTPDIVQSLLHNGANVEKESSFNHLTKQQEQDWRLPIHVVAGYSKPGMAAVLLQNGASALSKAGNGWLPVHVALRYADKQTIEYFLDRTTKEFEYVEKGGGRSCAENRHFHYMMGRGLKIACKGGSLEGLTQLVGLFGKLSELALDDHSYEGLHNAVKFGRRELTEYLLSQHSFSSATLRTVNRSTKFESLEPDRERPGNNVKDYEACKLMILNAINRVSRNNRINTTTRLSQNSAPRS